MTTRGYWISLTDGENRRRTYIVATSIEFALMSARYFLEGSNWRIV